MSSGGELPVPNRQTGYVHPLVHVNRTDRSTDPECSCHGELWELCPRWQEWGITREERAAAEARADEAHRALRGIGPNPTGGALTSGCYPADGICALEGSDRPPTLDQLRGWLADQFDEELVHTIATAIEGEGSGCDHADDLSCSTCTARTATEAVNRVLRAALDESGLDTRPNPSDGAS